MTGYQMNLSYFFRNWAGAGVLFGIYLCFQTYLISTCLLILLICHHLSKHNFKLLNPNISTSRLKEGDPETFKKAFEYFGDKIYAFAFSYLKNEAEAQEIVQEVFLKLWNNRLQLKVDSSLQSYLFTIAFNAVKKSFLKKSKEEAYKHQLVDELDGETGDLDFERQYQLVVQKLELFIEEMPERRKQIFVARKKLGKSQKEIASEMDISVKTVENQITEAMKFLKKRFSEEMPEGIYLLTLIAAI